MVFRGERSSSLIPFLARNCFTHSLPCFDIGLPVIGLVSCASCSSVSGSLSAIGVGKRGLGFFSLASSLSAQMGQRGSTPPTFKIPAGQ